MPETEFFRNIKQLGAHQLPHKSTSTNVQLLPEALSVNIKTGQHS